jgi:hypothetical protein
LQAFRSRPKNGRGKNVNAKFDGDVKYWTAAGSEAPRRFRTATIIRCLFIAAFAKAVSSLRSATAVQKNFVDKSNNCLNYLFET